MKTKTTYLIILLGLLVNTCFAKEPGNNNLIFDPSTKSVNAKYTLVRRDDNISIYSRWITVTESRSTRQLKAKFVIDRPAENVVLILRDEKSYKKWMKSAKTYYRIKTINSNQWYSYVQFSVPWPLNNQDCILKYEVSTSEDSSRTVVTLVSEPDLLNSYKGIERISHLEGAWIITRIGSFQTCVEYYVYSKQEPKFPTWLTAPIIEKNLMKTMTAFREIVMNGSK